MNPELKESMSELIKATLKNGADECDVILSKGKSFSLSAQKNEIDKYQVSGSQVMGLRVIKDNKVGLAYTESMAPEALEHASKSAIQNAAYAPENPYESINVSDVELISENEYSDDKTTTDEKIDFCLRLEAEVLKRDSRVQTVPYNGFSEANIEKYYMNSKNTFTFDSEYYQSCYTSALLKEGNESGMHYHSSMGRKLADLNLEECVSESLFHAGELLKATSLKTGHYDIIFIPDTFESVFGCFSNIFSGKGAMEKTNPFADKLGSLVMSEKISISDMPNYQDAFFKSLMDAEGLRQTDLELVKNGKLNSFYHNSATAKFFGIESTGHGARGAKSALAVKGTTRVIGTADISEETITSGEYFEVHSLQGLHSGANAISGDFSFAASGYLVKEGKRVQAVKGVTVSGNFHQMLQEVNLVGDKLHTTTEKSFFFPTFRFEKMSVAGI